MKKGLICDQLSIGYHSKKGRIALASGINLELKAGRLTCLIGSNGIGKSTLMRTLSGLSKPLAGKILLNEENLSKMPMQDRAKKISIVFASALQTGDLKVAQVVQLGRLPHTNWLGQLSETDYEIVAACLEKMDSLHLAQRYFSTLSDGERQKVLVARALAQETDIIMLDEPTAFLDWPSRVEILQKLKTVAHEQEKAVLISSHDLDLVLRIADEVWLMNDKRELLSYSPQALMANEGLRQAFSGKYYDFLSDGNGVFA